MDLTPTAEVLTPAMLYPVGLGKCSTVTPQGHGCVGTLETTDGIVRCSECGTMYPDHPVSKETIEFRERVKKEKPPVVNVELLDNQPGYGDRIKELERAVFKLMQRVHALEQRKK